MNSLKVLRAICIHRTTCEGCIVKDLCGKIKDEIPAKWDDDFMCKINNIQYLNQDTESDDVNHPSHYCQDGSMECIDEMVALFGIKAVMNFCLCNVWKYRKRALYKNGEEDMKKSDWYMKKFCELKEEVSENEYY